MFNLDGMIPKLCLLAQELGEEGREKQMRSASLQALSAMVICTMLIWTYYYLSLCTYFMGWAFNLLVMALHEQTYMNDSFAFIDNLFLMKHVA